MAAYVIADVTDKDPTVYAEYRSQVLATVTRYGGKFLVRGGAFDVMEGDWRPGRMVVLEFPDVATAKKWYASPEYTPLAKLRQSASTGSLLIVEGA
jgi:uncharacterized protein (DUF1330 family)